MTMHSVLIALVHFFCLVTIPQVQWTRRQERSNRGCKDESWTHQPPFLAKNKPKQNTYTLLSWLGIVLVLIKKSLLDCWLWQWWLGRRSVAQTCSGKNKPTFAEKAHSSIHEWFAGTHMGTSIGVLFHTELLLNLTADLRVTFRLLSCWSAWEASLQSNTKRSRKPPRTHVTASVMEPSTSTGHISSF